MRETTITKLTRGQRAVYEWLGRPVLRGVITIVAAGSYNLFMTWMLLFFLPFNFNYYNTLVSNQGSTTYDVYLFWTWIPTLLIFLTGIFWASGLFGKLAKWLQF